MGKKTILEQKVDTTTGEIIESTSYSYSVTNEPSFIKMYVHDLSRLYNLPGSTDNVLYELLKTMDYNNIVELSLFKEEALVRTLGCSSHMIHKAVKACIREGILLKKHTRTYLVNPNIFAKGTWKDIRKIQMTISYNKEGRLVETEVDSKNSLMPNLNFDNESNN